VDVRAVVEQVTAEARTLEEGEGFPRGYVARVRTAAGALALSDSVADDLRGAVLLLESHAVVDAEVPVTASSLPARLVKRLVKRLIGWYLRFLGHQVSALGQASARFGLAVADRLDRVEAEQVEARRALEAEVAALRARVAELEARSTSVVN
jgi:hypothetical protein